MVAKLKPLVLHAHATGPNPFKVAFALERLGVPYEIQLWQFGDDPDCGVKGSKFTKLNENGRTPAMEDPNMGVTAWESGAIMNYVRRIYDKDNQIGPRGSTPQDIVDFEKWECFLLSTLGPMTGQSIFFLLHHKPPNSDAVRRYQGQTLRCYDVLEGQLKKSNGASIIPGGVCAVDYHFEPWIRLHPVAGLTLDKHPLVKKWFDGMSKLEEVNTAYEKVRNVAERVGYGPESSAARRNLS